MPLTRYGFVVWGPATLAGAALAALASMSGWWWAIVPIAAAWFAIAWFFRDPIRRIPSGLPPGSMLSPADGRISAIERIDHHQAAGGPALVVRIFLSVLDVHVNRSPCAGEVVDILYVPGLFYDARSEASAIANECNLITLRMVDGRTMGVRQVAGKVARRIVCRAARGQRLAAGEKFGMIRFGSTAELILPSPDEVEVLVGVGDRVRGGVSVLTRPARKPLPAAPGAPGVARTAPRA